MSLFVFILLIIIVLLLFRKPKTIEKEVIKEVKVPVDQEAADNLNKVLQDMVFQIEERRKELNELQETTAAVKAEMMALTVMKADTSIAIEKEKELLATASKQSAHLIKLINDTEQSYLNECQLRLKEANELTHTMLPLNEDEVNDLRELRSISNRFPRVGVALRKAVYEVYYRPLVTNLVRHATDGRRIQGIYKITNIDTGQCYIGQAVDIGDRWKTHVKRACGAETETQNKLYPAMRECGLHKFRFSIVEEVADQKMLRSRELFWQTQYSAVSFGYSVK